MKPSNKFQVKKAIKKLFKEMESVEPYVSCEIILNGMIVLKGSHWCRNGIKTYEIRGHIDTKPFSKKPGWGCFFSKSVESSKRLHKKIIKALHKYLEVDYGL